MNKIMNVCMLLCVLTAAAAAQQVSVNSADYSRKLSPGALASAFGANLAALEAAPSAFPLPTELAGTRVLVNGRAASLLYVSPYQINYQIPADTPVGNVDIVIERTNGLSFRESITVTSAAFGAFSFDATGTGGGAILDGRTFQQGPFDVTTTGGESTILALFGTGLGEAASTDAASNRVHVTVGGIEATVLYAGPQNYFAGLDQINFEVPPAAANSGMLPVVVSVDDQPANSVTVDLKLTEAAGVSVAVDESFTESTEVAALHVSPFSDIDSLKVTLRTVNLVTDNGVTVAVIAAPVTVDLLSPDAAAKLVSRLNVKVGTYVSMTAEISDLAASFKGQPVAMTLANKAVNQRLKSPLTLSKDTAIGIRIAFDVRASAKKQTDGSYVFDPVVLLNPILPISGPAPIQKFEGRISSIDAPARSLKVTKGDGTNASTIVINATNAKIISADGKTVEFSSLKVGDKVEVAGQLNSSGVVEAALIVVGVVTPPPARPVFVTGTINAIDITAKVLDLNVETLTGVQTLVAVKNLKVKWDGTTKFGDDLFGPITADKLRVGQRISSQLAAFADPAMALSVVVIHSHILGTVADTSGLPGSFLVNPVGDPRLASVAVLSKVTLTATTRIKSVFGADLKPADITQGSQIDAVGDQGSSRLELTAIYVVVFGAEVSGTTTTKEVDATARTFVVTDAKGNKTTIALSDRTVISVNDRIVSITALMQPTMLVKPDDFLKKLAANAYRVTAVGLKNASGRIDAMSVRAELIK